MVVFGDASKIDPVGKQTKANQDSGKMVEPDQKTRFLRRCPVD